MSEEKLGFSDRIVLVCRRKDGSIKWKIDTAENPESHSMAKTGMAEVAALILTDVGGTAFDYIGIGTSETGESADHEDLQTPVKRKAGVGTLVTTAFEDDTCQIVVTFAAADTLSGTDEITEAGVFNAASDGILLFRKTFTAKSCDWDAGDTLEVTATCQMKQGA